MEIKLQQVKTPQQIQALCDIAQIVWHETYDSIIGPEQTDYMIAQFQSPQAVQAQLETMGYRYQLLLCDGEGAGFVGYSPRYQGSSPITRWEEKLFLSKIYLLSSFRGQGAVKLALAHVEATAKEEGLSAIWLTVNKNNSHAIEVYRHFGFVVVDEVVSDIGNGYVMDDYIMEKGVTSSK